MLMVNALVFLSVITALRLCTVVCRVRICTVLGKSDHTVRVCRMVFVEEAVILIELS